MIGNLEDVLKDMKEMNLEGKIGAAFGSYGWSGEAIEVIQDYLNQTNMDVQSTSQCYQNNRYDTCGISCTSKIFTKR